MKFTIVFTTLLCVSTSWAKKIEEPKDKREAQVSYGVPSSHGYQAPASYSHGDASAISVGAGYSIGGQAKPTYSFGGQGSGGALQIPSEGLSPSGHATIQLAPITLQPGQFSGGDFSQIMNQLSHSLNSGGLTLQPSNAIAEFHQGGENTHGAAQQQELLFPQFAYNAPKYELSQQFAGAPAYSSGVKGLSSYTSTGPVLFTPNEQNQQPAGHSAPSLSYGAASSGHSLGDASTYTLGNAAQSLGSSGSSFGDATHSFGSSGHSLGGSGHSLGGSGHSLGGTGHSLGSSGHSLGGAGHSLSSAGHSLGSSGSLSTINLGGPAHSFGGSYKQLGNSYAAAPSKNSFKPSAFLGASVQSEGGHGISSLSGAYSAPTFGGFRNANHGTLTIGSPSHGSVSFGSPLSGFGNGFSKFVAPAYQSGKAESLDGSSALAGHYASPPATTYGTPASYIANSAHAASSNRPLYISTKYRSSPGNFGQGSTAYRAPVAGHSALTSYSSGPKYNFAGSNSAYEANDAHGSASETSYNTIKYSEELKPRVN